MKLEKLAWEVLVRVSCVSEDGRGWGGKGRSLRAPIPVPSYSCGDTHTADETPSRGRLFAWDTVSNIRRLCLSSVLLSLLLFIVSCARLPVYLLLIKPPS